MLDVFLPRFNGMDVYDWLRSSRFADIPVALWTAAGDDARGFGDLPVVAKNDAVQTLVAEVRRLLEDGWRAPLTS